MQSVGVYVSIPFCKAKCTFCNFASGVFAGQSQAAYIERICTEIESASDDAARLGFALPSAADTLYLGGGTPSLLEPAAIERIFAALRGRFLLDTQAEITVECAPGQLEDRTLEAYQRHGVNRISLGVQSFIDEEAAAVGRLHTGAMCRAEIDRLRRAGVASVGLDLIVGLPRQTAASWRFSLEQAIESGVDHVSVYMLEVDEDSRLGREALAGGARYGAGALADEEQVADLYLEACERLGAAGLEQYEISNFARAGFRSRHNLKYWRREPYVGFGLDAHSMLRRGQGGLRWANDATMQTYLAGELVGLGNPARTAEFASQRGYDPVSDELAFEEEIFLGLRLNEGMNLTQLRKSYGRERCDEVSAAALEAADAGYVVLTSEGARLTPRGRLASNEVFGRLLEQERVYA